MAPRPAPIPVKPVSQFRDQQLREMTGNIWWRGVMLVVPIVVGAVTIMVFPEYNPVAVFVLAAIAAALAGVIGTYVFAVSSAEAAFMQTWARSRGWAEDGEWYEATPLLCAGDRREAEDRLRGPLANGNQAVLCHYTYVVETESTDSHGDSTTSSQSYRFTVVQTDIADPGITSLTLHPRSFGDNRLLDWVDSAVTSNRVVELESSELEREYKLEVGDSASDVAVRVLFEPTFIVWCLNQTASRMLFELGGGRLVVAIPDHSYDAAQLDGLVEKASTIAARIADASAATRNA